MTCTSRGHAVARGLVLGAALAFCTAAAAQTAFTTQAVNLRAGPDRQFPLVAWLPGGVGVSVIGCIDGWRWCDVVAGPNRGWVYARFLSIPFQNQPVTVFSNGGMLGLPIITFSIGPYWDNFYRGQPWFGRRSYWSNWSPPPPVWRPPPPAWRPPPPVRPLPPPRPTPPIAQPRPPGQGPGMGPPPSRPGPPPGQGPGTNPPPRPTPPPGQGPGMGPGAPPGNINRPPRGGGPGQQ